MESELPAVTVNTYGKGQAVYVAVPAQLNLMQSLLNHFYAKLQIYKGPETPKGVAARQVGNFMMYVNTTSSRQHVTVPAPGQGILTGRNYESSLQLEPYEVEVIKGTQDELEKDVG